MPNILIFAVLDLLEVMLAVSKGGRCTSMQEVPKLDSTGRPSSLQVLCNLWKNAFSFFEVAVGTSFRKVLL